MMRPPFVPVTKLGEYGAALLTMVLGAFGHHAELSEVREATGLSGESVSARDLVHAARGYGLGPRGRRLSPEALAGVQGPAILHWETDNFVVLDRWTRRGARIVDPVMGPRTVSRADVAASFSGVCIDFSPGAAFVQRPRRRVAGRPGAAIARGAAAPPTFACGTFDDPRLPGRPAPGASGARYLTYDPWHGDLNNSRICFESVAVIAHLLGRTLVVPRRYRRLADPRLPVLPPHPADFFDLEQLSAFVDVVWEDQDRYAGVCADLARAESEGPGTLALGEGLASGILCWPGLPRAGSAARRAMVRFAASRPNIVTLPDDERAFPRVHLPPLLTHYYALCFVPAPVAAGCQRLVREGVRYRREIVELAREITARLGRFSAAHVRRGDFAQTRPRTQLSADRLALGIGRRVPAGSTLYIATDHADLSLFGPLRATYDLAFFSTHASDATRALPPGWIAAAEQIVCSEADVFVGTPCSTFSGYISRLRGYRGAADTVVHFIDGTSDADLGAPPLRDASWRRSLDRGVPLWAREYKEGWETPSAEI